jgi:hypothetical protein
MELDGAVSKGALKSLRPSERDFMRILVSYFEAQQNDAALFIHPT